uniref:Uncharacterized protein n=1 Tax=Rhizophora mucronata TaxID=61149 RepID=A0A2P2Q445_RHIMU
MHKAYMPLFLAPFFICFGSWGRES